MRAAMSVGVGGMIELLIVISAVEAAEMCGISVGRIHPSRARVQQPTIYTTIKERDRR
jgi:hypothetical protein